MRKMALFVWIGLSCVMAAERPVDPVMTFLDNGHICKQVTLAGMKAVLKAHEITVDDPMYGKQKSYAAFALADVMAMAYGKQWEKEAFSDVAFRAHDGYEAVSTYEKIGEEGGYLVFKDLQVPGWEPVDRKEANPGPFYIVWSKPDQSTANAYPWPWQLASINRMDFERSYPNIFPAGAEASKTVMGGYRTFKRRCVRCHAMSAEGGKVGPDLNAPQNILQYRSEAMVKAYIYSPSQFRYSNMPEHTDLTDGQLDELISYLRYKKEHRERAR